MERDIEVTREQIEQEVPIEQEEVIVNVGGTKDHARLTHLDYERSGHTGFQPTLESGTNIKTINGNSILGSGNLDIEGGYPEVPEKLYEYSNLLDLLNEPMYIPDGIYTVSQEWYCDIPKANDEWVADNINPNSILYIYRNYGFISWTGPTSSMYWSNGDETFTGGILTTVDDINSAIDEKLGSNVVMADTEQTISGKKKFTSPNGTIFENEGGLILKYLSSAPEFKIIPDNNGNFDIYYQNTQIGRIGSNNTILYRAIRPNLNETVDLGTSSYNFNKIYTKSLVSDVTEKIVANLISNDSNLIPISNNFLSIGNTSRQWSNLYLANTLRFDPQSNTKLENLKNLTVNLIKLGQQRGSTTTWMDSNFLQYDADDIKCVGKLLGGLNVNNMAIHNIPNTPDDGTSPINKNYADTNLQGKLTAGTGIAITNNVISSTLEGIDYEVDQELPATGEKGIIYLIPNGSSEQENIYDEYIWIPPLQEGESGRFEFIGTTQTDLTNYVDLTSAQTITGAKTFSSTISPSTNNNIDLGDSSKKWKDLYLSGNLSDGTNSIAVNKIANKDNFVTLSQADYDALATKDPNTFYFIEEE